MTAPAHEHAALCRALRRPDASVESDIAADVIDSLHERIAVLEAHIALSTASDLYHGAILGVGTVIAELSASLPASAPAPGSTPDADAGASTTTPGVMYADEWPADRGQE